MRNEKLWGMGAEDIESERTHFANYTRLQEAWKLLQEENYPGVIALYPDLNVFSQYLKHD